MNETLKKIDIEPGILKGKATIEIFEEGKLVERVSKDNYINVAYRNAAARLAADGMLTQNNFSLEAPINESWYVAPNAISLNNNDLPPSPTRSEIPLGDCIGYGELGSTTPNSKKGTFISLESVVDKRLYRKLVFDFPTSSAIGTFNNIYTFQGYKNSSTDTRMTTFRTFGLTQIGSEYPQMYAMDDIYAYVLLKTSRNNSDPTTKLMRFTKENFAKALYLQDATDLYDILTLTEAVNTFAYLDGYFYFTGYNNGRLYRSTKNNPNTLTLVKTFSTSELYKTRYLSVGADPVNKKLFLLALDSNVLPPEGNLYVIDKTNFSVLDRMYGSEYNSNCAFLQFDSRGRYLSIDGTIIDTQLKKAIEVTNGKYIASDGPFGLPLTYGSYLYSYLGGAFSRFILDSPVTKTSTQTMKITYEFTLEQAPVTAAPIL